jgi:hypothetical protein
VIKGTALYRVGFLLQNKGLFREGGWGVWRPCCKETRGYGEFLEAEIFLCNGKSLASGFRSATHFKISLLQKHISSCMICTRIILSPPPSPFPKGEGGRGKKYVTFVS